MTPLRWREIEMLFHSALTRPTAERAAFLARACAQDATLCADVQSLLDQPGSTGGFLSTPAALLVARQITNPAGSTSAAPVVGPTFEADVRLADRFRVIRFVGQGGMGSVYEAWDEKLNRRVALKCATGNHGGRLPPEARAACEVSHYNLCKVHDLHVVPTPEGEIDVLSMEFIEGETLAQCLDREGPLAPERARDVIAQICDGLGQAHRQGVVHGDLKTGNVLLGLSPDGTLRAVITDFGLATLRVDPDSGERGGTLDYMAPELMTGGRSTTASDMYALGVLMHVVLTGRFPLRSGSAAPQGARTSAGSNFTQDDARDGSMAPEREAIVGKLPRPWKKAVAGCLATDPAQRLASPADITRILRPRRRALSATAALFVVAIVGATLWRTAPAPRGPPVRLAVLPLTAVADAEAGRSPAARAGVAEEVAERLSGRRRNFTVMPPAEVAVNHVDSAAKARTVLGASHVLVTHVSRAANVMVLDATLIDLESGHALQELSGTYAAGDPQAIVKALVAIVTEAFHLPRAGPQESLTGPAAVAYAKGVDLLREAVLNPAAAMPYFAEAVRLDPTSPLPYAGLAEAQLRRSMDEGGDWLAQAAATIEKARSLNADSVPVLLVLAGVAQQRGRHEEAINELTRATELEPSNSEAWRRLALSYERTNRTADAIATYQRAIAAQPDYYRHYLSFGNFYMAGNQFDRAEQLYRKVTQVAPGLGSGHTNLGLALMQQGRFAEAERSLLTALRLQESANLLVNLGALYYAQSRYEEALGFFERSLAAGPATVIRYADLGDALRQLGRSRASGDAYRQGIRLAEDGLAVNPRDAASRVFLGMLSARLGDERRAEQELSQALAMAPDNASVLRQATIGYEALGQRQKSLAILARAPRSLLLELSRQPDVPGLRQDPRFQQLANTQQ